MSCYSCGGFGQHNIESGYPRFAGFGTRCDGSKKDCKDCLEFDTCANCKKAGLCRSRRRGIMSMLGFGGLVPDFMTPVWDILGGVNDWFGAMTSGSDKPLACGILSRPAVSYGKWMCKTDWGLIAIGAAGLFLLSGKIKLK